LEVYAEMLGQDPLDRRAHEGLLMAAAGTGDPAQLGAVWQQVCACVGAEIDVDLQALYERLVREVSRGLSPGMINGHDFARRQVAAAQMPSSNPRTNG
jgi:hypothetical protein